MPKAKPTNKKKKPPSQMIRVPTPLIKAVRALSSLHRLGHTEIILQELQQVISKIDSDSDTDFDGDSKLQKQLEERIIKLESSLVDRDVISKLEGQVEELSKTVALLQASLLQGNRGGGGYKRQGYGGYQTQSPPELGPMEEENLARRLGVEVKSLIKQRKNSSSPEDFLAWSRNKETMGVGWRFNSQDGLYYPVK